MIILNEDQTIAEVLTKVEHNVLENNGWAWDGIEEFNTTNCEWESVFGNKIDFVNRKYRVAKPEVRVGAEWLNTEAEVKAIAQHIRSNVALGLSAVHGIKYTCPALPHTADGVDAMEFPRFVPDVYYYIDADKRRR